ncbi:MAG: HEPN domain-containing protein [Anaerolineales bacterium]|nr:HEPN domain-containing protein [Anaerolineales bacterium]
MKAYAGKLLSKAIDTIEGAELLLNHGKTDLAAGRAYYAMFYVNEFDLKLNQHSQVIAAYGKNFSKTKALDPKYHRWLRDGFDKRISGDYGVDTGIGEILVADMINHAREFLEAAQNYLT